MIAERITCEHVLVAEALCEVFLDHVYRVQQNAPVGPREGLASLHVPGAAGMVPRPAASHPKPEKIKKRKDKSVSFRD